MFRFVYWILVALCVVGIVTIVSACATQQAPEPQPPTFAFPPDMVLVCHDNWAHLYSELAQKAIRLPFRCADA